MVYCSAVAKEAAGQQQVGVEGSDQAGGTCWWASLENWRCLSLTTSEGGMPAELVGGANLEDLPTQNSSAYPPRVDDLHAYSTRNSTNSNISAVAGETVDPPSSELV